MPIELELFSVSGGGVLEPRADWTEAASRHMKSALLGATTLELEERHADNFADVGALHAVVARSIAFHHFGPGNLRLPTKDGKRDGSRFEQLKLKPVQFGGKPDFRFEFRRARKPDNVNMRSLGYGAVSRGELISPLYAAPRVALVARHRERVEQMAKSAVLEN